MNHVLLEYNNYTEYSNTVIQYYIGGLHLFPPSIQVFVLYVPEQVLRNLLESNNEEFERVEIKRIGFLVSNKYVDLKPQFCQHYKDGHCVAHLSRPMEAMRKLSMYTNALC